LILELKRPETTCTDSRDIYMYIYIYIYMYVFVMYVFVCMYVYMYVFVCMYSFAGAEEALGHLHGQSGRSRWREMRVRWGEYRRDGWKGREGEGRGEES
jgi:hypothetical protein